MRSLFTRFFLAFWLALTTFAVTAVFLVSHSVEQLRDQERSALRVDRYQHEAQQVALDAGLAGLQAWARQLDEREALPIFLLDATGHDLLERDVPELLINHPRFRAAFTAANEYPLPPTASRRPPRPMPFISVPGGERYFLVPDVSRLTMGRLLRRPHLYALPLALGLAISALVCGLLVLYLVKPLRVLRSAVNACADGQFDQRIAPLFQDRHDEIAALARDVDSMSQALENAFRTQRQLLNDVSHELRSPLARMQVAVELAEAKSTASHSELQRIGLEIQQLDQLIGLLLSVGRVDAMQDQPRQPIDLVALLQQVVDDANYETHERGTPVTLCCSGPMTVFGYEEAFRSVFINVIRNALKYGPEDAPVTVDARLLQGRQQALIHIDDQGPGVPETELSRIFEPFVRLDPSRNQATGGFGLGLAIVARAVALHQGIVSACNLEPCGFRVEIQLPVVHAVSE